MEAIRKLETQNIKLAIAFVALNIVDAVLTRMADIRGTLCEANPVGRYFIEQSWRSLWEVKMVAVVGCTIIFLLLARRYPQQVKRIFIILIGVMLGVCLINAIGVL